MQDSSSTPNISSAFDQIQGNIVGGFNKDFQDFLFLRFKSAVAGRTWIAEIAGPDAEASLTKSSSRQVLKFNGEFKALRKQGLRAEDFIRTAWNNLALSYQGLKALGVADAALKNLPDEFKAGMASRAATIGDVGSSAPERWAPPFAPGTQVHAVLIVAADTADLLADRLEAVRTKTFTDGVEVLPDPVHGRARLGSQNGHEHFGFKDGVSQPGLRGVDLPDDPVGNPDQGHPGQDLLWPGEFVLGYPTQIATAQKGHDGPNPEPGPVNTSGPGWTVNGSYLVFRRLDQDVPAFDMQIDALAAQVGTSPDLIGAKLVGRYKSGCPLEPRTFQAPVRTKGFRPPIDPGVETPALADDDSLNLNFEFGEDAEGVYVPLASHIRKAYPRDENTGHGDDSESDTQTHRLLRRGIAFGGSIGDEAGGAPGDRRGLLFLSYQQSIANQFEFVQARWINREDFPPHPAGQAKPGLDPIIAQAVQGTFRLDDKHQSVMVKHFVTTSGGEYFFQPSIDALQKIGAGTLGGAAVEPAAPAGQG